MTADLRASEQPCPMSHGEIVTWALFNKHDHFTTMKTFDMVHEIAEMVNAATQAAYERAVAVCRKRRDFHHASVVQGGGSIPGAFLMAAKECEDAIRALATAERGG